MTTAQSPMLGILKKLGDATPPPIRLSRLIQSPLQTLFSFAFDRDNRALVAKLFELLAEQSVNLRFISEHPGEAHMTRIQFCADAEAQARALGCLAKTEIAEAIWEFSHHEEMIIVSLYPFNGQPNVAERVFTISRQREIKIRAANTATSVFSCIVSADRLEALISALKQVFIWL